LQVRASGRLCDIKRTSAESLANQFISLGLYEGCVGQSNNRVCQRTAEPFENRMFPSDYTQSILIRATTEQVNGIWQGVCYQFCEGFSTGILNLEFTSGGNLLYGGTNRSWPARGINSLALERLEWNGKMPFETNRIMIAPQGFKVTFTKQADRATDTSMDSYVISALNHP
jgi:hypothetical protein